MDPGVVDNVSQELDGSFVELTFVVEGHASLLDATECSADSSVMLRLLFRVDQDIIHLAFENS